MLLKTNNQRLILADEKKQITVIVGLVVRDEKILMVKRRESEVKEAHLKWEFPGGKVNFGETIEESIIREIREETGVITKVKRLLPCTITNYWKYPWGIQQTLIFGFECEFISEEKRRNNYHFNDVEWVPLDEVKMRESLPGVLDFLNSLLSS